ncbi:hypothetical protein PPERSA_03683 [Pseudocohnilembus persalinus]|uniref:Uncharacterized protein n=1 Tax=Pseudocohnilembus persalinus TaxID=266149 RepID=A0A0V0QG47_PSEPJ|nr:hypothetical protein PPERSA_03683 [Pseudocohnilembus persalinus]|eukprot:KRX01179.1 hypothetical protein PPERSA_03683 [Pseudocohnilembus persalinus]
MENEENQMEISKGKMIKIRRPISQHKSKNIKISGQQRKSQLAYSTIKTNDQDYQQDETQIKQSQNNQKHSKILSNGSGLKFTKQNSQMSNRNPAVNSINSKNIINNSKIRYQQQQQQEQNPVQSANSQQSRISKNSQNQKNMMSNQNIKSKNNTNNYSNSNSIYNNNNNNNMNIRQSQFVGNNESNLPPVNNNKNMQRQKTQKIEKQTVGFNKNIQGIDQDMLDEGENYTQTSQIQIPKQQFFNIDIEKAVEFFVTKGRNLRDKIEQEEIPMEVIQQLIWDNKVFKIQYNHLLQKMCQQKQINAEFKNMQKKPFEKIEKFFIKKLDENLMKKAMDLEIKQKCKIARENIRLQIRQQREEIQRELKEEWNWADF